MTQSGSARAVAGLRVLVIEGGLTVRMVLCDALVNAGFEAIPCPDLARAIEFLRETARGPICAVVNPSASPPDLDAVAELGRAGVGEPLILDDPPEGAAVNRTCWLGRHPSPDEVVLAVSRQTSARTILVIDDSATYRHELRLALESAGYRVEEAETGELGLQRLEERHPDAIIVDGVLPGIDGATVVRRIKSEWSLRHLPCCLLTAAESEHDELRSLDAGADAHVRKSEDMGVILARIAALLRHAPQALEVVPNEQPKRRLLAVDDSMTYLSALGEILEQAGFHMTLVTSGEEALLRLDGELFDAILLDLGMPGLSGTETCRLIKRDPRLREIPLIMLTARDDRDTMIEGINAGADDYIAKSADFEVLKARLRAQLRRKHFEDENHRIRERLVRREAEERHLAALEEKNRELARARDEAERMSRAKSAFLANMSHELRTPLNAIIGFAELLHDRIVTPDMPEHQDFLGDILKSGLHLLQLINDILDLSKVEAGKLEFYPSPISLVQLVGEVTAALRPQAEAKGLALSSELDPAVESLTLDASRLKQILFNFLSNAVKFTDHGRVLVRARPEDGDKVRLEVADTGVGIPASELERLFVDFQQLDVTASKRHQGTGLGLALTRRLVEAQGGTVGVTSRVGEGSTFHAILPRHATPRGRALGRGDAAPAAAPREGGGAP